MKKLCTLFALMAFTLSIHAAITVINYELKDSWGDGWNNASISIVEASTGTTWATLTISSGSESSGSVNVVAGRNYNIVWNSGSYDSECSFTLTDARGIVILSHDKGKSISAGTLLEYKVPIKGDVNGDFDVNIADVMDVVSYIIHGDTSTPVTPPTPSTVEISYELIDSYGDGWNGAAIRIVDTDTYEEVAVLTIDDGEFSSGTVTLTAGHRYDFYWQAGGWDSECMFDIYNDAGEILFSSAYEEPVPDEPELVPLFVGAKNAKKPMVIFDGSRFDDSSIPSGLLFVGDKKVKKGKKAKKAPIAIGNDGIKVRPKEVDLPVDGGLYDGEVFLSYEVPDDASSSTPDPSPRLKRDVNGDKDVNISDVMELVSMVIHGTPIPDIAVSKEALAMLVYSHHSYNIIDITAGSGNFEITSSDPDNLHVYVSGLSISMYSNTLGSYVVTIKDKESGKTKDIQVTVKEAEPSCPDGNHPHIIDPGLPSGTKWACCNVDATSPETFGGYYAWGETAEKSDYSWASYTHCDGTEETCHDLGTSICGTKYDVAHYKWGDNWYMPSYDQVAELFRNSTSFSLTTMNGVRGAFFTFSNGSNIFLPCGGWKEGTEVNLKKSDSWDVTGYYWLGSLPSGNYRGNHLHFMFSSESGGYGYSYFSGADTYLGYNVRPVSTEKVPLAISATSVEVEIGGNTTVEVTAGSGNYTVESSNTGIATASVSGSSVSITGVGGGSTAITVTDTQSGNKITINVTVPVPTITSPCPDGNHPHMIDLGLPSGTLWSCCNVGAGSPDGYGDYCPFAYGGSDSEDEYEFNCDENESGDICGSERDVVYNEWGSPWLLPNCNQYDELLKVCMTEWVSLNGVNGYLFKSPNGNSIFLPASGSLNNEYEKGNNGYYWTGNYFYEEQGPATESVYFNFDNSGKNEISSIIVGPRSWWDWDYHGFSVRPVCPGTPNFSCPDDNHPHMIDLGLPSGTKWACCNVDTKHPENQCPTNNGGYYAWGETEVKAVYDESTYEYYQNGSYVDIGSDIAGTPYDVAHLKWGGSWVMPSSEQFSELIENCKSFWISQDGLIGRVFVASNGSHIFLPAAGHRWGGYHYSLGGECTYWSSTQYDSTSHVAYDTYIEPGDWSWNWIQTSGFDVGNSVRPVSTASSLPHLQLSTTTLYDLPTGEGYEVEILSGSGSYTVESSDEFVAFVNIVDNIIYILADAMGEATITVTDTQTGETATIEVRFYWPAPPFSLSESELQLALGESEIVICYDGTAVGVESSDEAVATASITDDGDVEITAVGYGTATITVTSDWNGETATVEVSVPYPSDEPLMNLPSKQKSKKKSSR